MGLGFFGLTLFYGFISRNTALLLFIITYTLTWIAAYYLACYRALSMHEKTMLNKKALGRKMDERQKRHYDKYGFRR